MIIMYDSITAADIPADASAVAGYVDGQFRWSEADWMRFATPRRIRIAVSAATNDGHALDVETGDATPQQAPAWVRMRMAMGIKRPIIYCNRSTWPVVQATCSGLPVQWWIATLDRTTPFLLSGSDATQYAGQAQSGGHYDLSLCADSFFYDVAPAAPRGVGMGGRINSAPFYPQRLDIVNLTEDGYVQRAFSDGGAGGIDNDSQWWIVDKDRTPQGGFVLVDWCWDSGNRQVFYAETANHTAFLAVVNIDGSLAQGWSQLPVRVLPPVSTSAPIATQSPDAGLRAYLRATPEK